MATESSIKTLDGSEAKHTQPPEKHDKLWFADGSVILNVENVLFRVHRSILCSYSTKLETMMSIPQGGREIDDNSMMDGCPVVIINDDRSIEWVDMLNVIYYTRYLFVSPGMAVSRAASSLRLSTKYRLEDIRKRCILSLKRVSPEDLDGTMNLYTSNKPAIFIAIQIAKIAFDCEAPTLLPSALYRICISFPMDGSQDDVLMRLSLPFELKARCLSGRARLHAAQSTGETALDYDEIVSKLQQSEPFNNCGDGTCNVKSFKRSWKTIAAHVPFPFDYGKLEGDLRPQCYRCVTKLKEAYLERQKKIWDSLPKYFGLGESWNELRKREQAW